MERKFWPNDFKYSIIDENAKKEIEFFQQASSLGCDTYLEEGMAYCATNKNGRTVDIVRRGGRNRYWQAIFYEEMKNRGEFYFEWFENGTKMMKLWMEGKDVDSIKEEVKECIVEKPGARGWR